MKYDFDTPVDRFGTDSMKWNVAKGELPMWVADMDFKTAPEIINAMERRIAHGVFGYAEVMDDCYEAYIDWWKNNHSFSMEKEWLIFCTGVIPAISSIVRKLTTPNENVVIQTPVYNIFFNSIINNGCRVLENELVYNEGKYEIDFGDLEEKLSNPQTSLMILCNPHNPIGKIWDREILAKIGSMCKKYGVTVISDEIHCDLTRPGIDYIPFASVSDECKDVSITCIAPTKAFNIAGMQTAAVCIPNPFLRHKVWRGLNTDEVAEPNSLATTVAITAFKQGGEWLGELREYLFDNRKIAEDYIEKEIPSATVVSGDATYLLWIDLRKDKISQEKDIAQYIREKSGLYLADGEEYGDTGRGFVRMNIACPRSVLLDGLNRLKTSILIET